MHDGQNLFFPARSNFNKVWAADAAAVRVAAAGTPPFIVVGIDQPGAARYRQYFPQALYDAASPALRAKFDRLAKGPITGDAYLAFLTDDLKPLIDRTYRTQPDPAHTAIAGSSMGGLISCYAFLARPDVFGRAACVSTHWPLADPADIGPFSTEVAGLWRQYLTVHLGPPAGRRLWLDHGTATLDANYAPWQTAIDADLAAPAGSATATSPAGPTTARRTRRMHGHGSTTYFVAVAIGSSFPRQTGGGQRRQ